MTRDHLHNAQSPAARRSHRRGGWFRAAAALGVPVAVIGALELVLRLVGYGHPTAFFLAEEVAGTASFVPNRQFGWRFFGRAAARTPHPVAFPRARAPGTIRVFVLGESAAYGDPQPDFGLAPMLHALLSERYPQTRFEVINAALTAINSHVVRLIARDCARAGGDIWVVYLGNNEVVGPFGAGTVFGAQTPPLAAIRAGLALRSARTGQLLEALGRAARRPSRDPAEWGGMEMFLEHQVPWDDARLERTHRHFERNLRAILETGQRAGAGIVVSTVAVNLKDCAPFGSGLPATLDAADQARWREVFERAVNAQAAGEPATALGLFRQAETVAGDVAELHFRLGHCARAVGDAATAHRAFRRAVELDRLRFRCDAGLNDLTRRVAGGRAGERIALVDAERELARQSPDGLPGAEFFYEHVHLTFEGNYLLARVIAEQVAALLPEPVRAQPEARADWASAEQCARRLGWSDWTRLAALGEIAGRLHEPPFTGQLDHWVQRERLERQMEALRRPGAATLLREAERRCAEALAMSPGQPALVARMAGVLESAGRLEEAERFAQRLTELLPHSAEGWNQRGVILARLQRNEEAAGMFRASLARDPENVFTRNHLAQTLARLGRPAEAILEYERALALKPAYATAHLGLGRLLEARGQAAAAEPHYAQARRQRVHRPADLALLARFCFAKGWLAEAATNFALAARMSPTDAALRLDAGRCANALGRGAEAGRYFAEAVALAPDAGEARFLLGRVLGGGGDDAGAAEQFAHAVRLMPDVVEARLNLGVALLRLGQTNAALSEFEEVLRRQPTHELARRYAAPLR